jgi:hypothetical protein
MSLLISLLAGVLSSIIAVIIVQSYYQTRKNYVHRILRKATRFVSSSCTVIVPAFPIEPARRSLISIADAIALAYVLEVCSTLKIKTDVMSTKRIESNLAADIVAIGGPSGNGTTEALLRTYCPGFRIHNAEDFSNSYYECGDHQFHNDADHSTAFIVRLASEHTQLPGTIFLLWGHHGVETTASAYFLREYPEILASLQKTSFFVALTLNRSLGYRSASKNLIDLSDYAFQA